MIIGNNRGKNKELLSSRPSVTEIDYSFICINKAASVFCCLMLYAFKPIKHKVTHTLGSDEGLQTMGSICCSILTHYIISAL